MPSAQGHKQAEQAAFWQAREDVQPLLTACALCGWSYQGEAADARQRAAEHRHEAHPEIRPKRRRSKGAFRQKLTEEDSAEIETERRRRMRLLGIE